MKKLTGILWLSLLFVALVPVVARAQFGRNDRNNSRSNDRVCVYQNSYFQGWEECYRPGDEIPDLGPHRNNISSIRVYGNAAVTVYDDKDYRGQSTSITSEVRDLSQLSSGAVFGGRSNWNDRIGSLRVTGPNSGNYSRNDRRDDRYDQNGNGNGRYNNNNGSVCVFEDANYRGRSQCFSTNDDVSDLGRLGGWSDRISSIRVMGNGRAVAYQDIDYRGERLVIDRDIPDLRSLRLQNSNRTWDNQISSIDIGGSRGRDLGRRYRY